MAPSFTEPEGERVRTSIRGEHEHAGS
ncbi:MAG: hypothetical protein XD78_0001, partial [Desulfotomaculum sp. 46_296]